MGAITTQLRSDLTEKGYEILQLGADYSGKTPSYVLIYMRKSAYYTCEFKSDSEVNNIRTAIDNLAEKDNSLNLYFKSVFNITQTAWAIVMIKEIAEALLGFSLLRVLGPTTKLEMCQPYCGVIIPKSEVKNAVVPLKTFNIDYDTVKISDYVLVNMNKNQAMKLLEYKKLTDFLYLNSKL